MRTVYKYQFDIVDDTIMLNMPIGAEIVSVGISNMRPTIWAIIEEDAPHEAVKIRVAGTGHSLTDDCKKENYIGRIEQGRFQWHIFKLNANTS